MKTCKGFTLVELVIVISIMALVASAVSRFISEPVAAYLDTSRRATLVDVADTALHRLTREVRLALPNSVRVAGNGTAVEFLRVVTGGRYRSQPPGNPLDFSLSSDSFDVIGQLEDAALVGANASAVQGHCIAGTVACLVIHNTGQSGASAYAGDNIAAVRSASASAVSFHAATPFPLTSPGQRFYVIDGPVSFVCAGGMIYRYSGYPVTAAHSAVDSAAELDALGASKQLLADKVSTCKFEYDPGKATLSGTLRVVLAHTEEGESVRLLQQVQVRNAP